MNPTAKAILDALFGLSLTVWRALFGLSLTAWMTIFSGALVAVGIAQFCIYREMHRTTKHIERAWISLDTLEVEPFGYTHVIVMDLRNSGRTPGHIKAANVTIRGWIRNPDTDGGGFVGSAKLAIEPDYDPGDFNPPAVLVPGETSRWRYVVPYLNGQTSARLLSVGPDTQCEIWIYGKIEYAEQFHPSTIRTYKWARQYDPILSKSRSIPGTRYPMLFAHLGTPKYNDAD